jgi:hypothetical protein
MPPAFSYVRNPLTYLEGVKQYRRESNPDFGSPVAGAGPTGGMATDIQVNHPCNPIVFPPTGRNPTLTANCDRTTSRGVAFSWPSCPSAGARVMNPRLTPAHRIGNRACLKIMPLSAARGNAFGGWVALDLLHTFRCPAYWVFCVDYRTCGCRAIWVSREKRAGGNLQIAASPMKNADGDMAVRRRLILHLSCHCHVPLICFHSQDASNATRAGKPCQAFCRILRKGADRTWFTTFWQNLFSYILLALTCLLV